MVLQVANISCKCQYHRTTFVANASIIELVLLLLFDDLCAFRWSVSWLMILPPVIFCNSLAALCCCCLLDACFWGEQKRRRHRTCSTPWIWNWARSLNHFLLGIVHLRVFTTMFIMNICFCVWWWNSTQDNGLRFDLFLASLNWC